jgi:hypothetical protein
VFDHEFTI